MAVHNPHVVKPKLADYQPGAAAQDRYTGTFPSPLPKYLREVGKGGEIRDGREARDWRRELEVVTGSQPATSSAAQLRPGDKGLDPTRLTSDALPDSGMFSMSLQEARFFLTRRAGVVSSRDEKRQEKARRRNKQQQQQQHVGDGGFKATGEHATADDAPVPASQPALTPMQQLVDAVEAEFASWQDQVVYLAPTSDAGSRGTTTQLNTTPRSILPPLETSVSSEASAGRLEEHHRLPQSLSYLIPDPFDRLTVHCLARVWGLRSFSKPVANSAAGNGGSQAKLTWILKPPRSAKSFHPSSRSYNVAGQVQGGRDNPFLVEPPGSGPSTATNGLSNGMSSRPPASGRRVSSSRGPGGLETPPTTDVGTSASEFEDSELEETDDGASSVAAEDEAAAADETFRTAVQDAGDDSFATAIGPVDAASRRLMDLSIEEGDEEEEEEEPGYEHSGSEGEEGWDDGTDDDLASSIGELADAPHS